MLDLGTACAEYQDRHVRNLDTTRIEADETVELLLREAGECPPRSTAVNLATAMSGPGSPSMPTPS